MRTTFAFFIFILSVTSPKAQHQFTKLYGDSALFGMDLHHSTGETTILHNVGTCFDSLHLQCLNFGILKLDSADSAVCSFGYSNNANDTIYSASKFIKTNDGDFIIIGNSKVQTDTFSIPVVYKFDSALSFVKANEFNFGKGSNLNDVREDFDGNFYFFGNVDSPSINPVKYSLVLFKTDSSLNILWSKVYESQYYVSITDLDFTPDGNIIACGAQADSNYYNSDILVMKIDTSGQIMWCQKFITGDPFSYSISIDVDSYRYFVYTASRDSLTFSQLNILLSLDTSGNILWSKKYAAQFTNNMDMLRTVDNGFAFAGSRQDILYVPAILKTDSFGNIEWSYEYSFAADYSDLSQADDGGFYAIARTYDPNFPSGLSELMILKTDSLGNIGCNSFAITVPVFTNVPITVISHPLTMYDSMPLIKPFTLQRDTLILHETVICNHYTNVHDLIDDEITLFPIPANNYINVRNSNLITEAHVYDVLGRRCVVSHPRQADFQLNISELESGIYILKLFGSGANSVVKFLKE